MGDPSHEIDKRIKSLGRAVNNRRFERLVEKSLYLIYLKAREIGNFRDDL